MPLYIASWKDGRRTLSERFQASRGRAHYLAQLLAGHETEVLAKHPDGREVTRQVPRKYRLELVGRRRAVAKVRYPDDTPRGMLRRFLAGQGRRA